MALVWSKLYYALLAAGVPEEQAMEAAAEEVDFATKDDIQILRTAVKADIEAAKTEILKWVISAMGFQTIAIIGALVALVRH